MRVMNINTRAIGVVLSVHDEVVVIDFHGTTAKYAYPAAFANILELEDVELQNEIQGEGIGISFDSFKREYSYAIQDEISFLKATGGKKYRIIDGERIATRSGDYLYAFDTDTDLHFPDGTAIKLGMVGSDTFQT